MAKGKKITSKFKKTKIGLKKVNVPNLSGLSRAAAQAALANVGLTYSESTENTTDSGLDNILSTQNISPGTTVEIGTPVNFTYKIYVAPYYNPYYNPYSNPPPYDNPYSNPPPYDNAPPYFNAPPEYPPLDLPPLNFNPPTKSIGITTLIITPNGLVPAKDLQVGDTLVSADIEGFPYDSLLNTPQDALAWTGVDPSISETTTTIVSLNRVLSPRGVLINGDVFSATHYILIKRENIAKFVLSTEVIHSDLVYDLADSTWNEIVDIQVADIPHEVVSINCEPYDIFFTEHMLVHDSVSV